MELGKKPLIIIHELLSLFHLPYFNLISFFGSKEKRGEEKKVRVHEPSFFCLRVVEAGVGVVGFEHFGEEGGFAGEEVSEGLLVLFCSGKLCAEDNL